MTYQDELRKMLRFLPYHWSKETNSNNYNFLKSFALIHSNLADNILELKYAIQIDTATGSYLDDIGLLFKLERTPSESDDSYRDRIKAYWLSYNRGGLKDNIIDAYATFFGVDSSKITLEENDAMIVEVFVDITDTLGTSYPTSEQLRDTINNIKAAGVKVIDKLIFTASEDDYGYNDAIVITTIPGTYIIADDTYQIYSQDILM